jgi:hypothetical protein
MLNIANKLASLLIEKSVNNFGTQVDIAKKTQLRPSLHNQFQEQLREKESVQQTSNVSQVAQVKKADEKVEVNNAFLSWDKVQKTNDSLSINSTQDVDLEPLKGLSNGALLTKLTNIDLSLQKTNGLDISEQNLTEINQARDMIGEQISRILLISNGKSSQPEVSLENSQSDNLEEEA